ncbi:MAG: GNAT family N-acetyltransferase [Planctomycetaceae bacterium]|nr:GNAT family N-acetyltransferase [Planctomycetaceae bacterium]
MAVAESAQGQGIGKQLLKTVFGIAPEMADRTGCVAVVVEEKPAAVAFYQRCGFEVL